MSRKERVLKDNSRFWLIIARILLLIMIVTWMYVIFNFSAQNGANSHTASDHVVTFIQKVVYITTGKDVSVVLAQGNYRTYVEFAVRKCAHMFIYFILSINVMLLLFTHQKMHMITRMLMTALICFLYACTDEFHQSFVAGRGSSFRDVLIDTSGALIGLIAALLIYCIIFTIYTKIQQSKIKAYNESIEESF